MGCDSNWIAKVNWTSHCTERATWELRYCTECCAQTALLRSNRTLGFAALQDSGLLRSNRTAPASAPLNDSLPQHWIPCPPQLIFHQHWILECDASKIRECDASKHWILDCDSSPLNSSKLKSRLRYINSRLRFITTEFFKTEISIAAHQNWNRE